MKNILVIGSGAYGTALATVLSDNKNNVTILGIDNKEINDININNKNSKYFPNVKLNKNIKAMINWEDAVDDLDAVIIAVPSNSISDVCVKINKHIKKKVGIINASKGFANYKDLNTPYTELKEKLNLNICEYIGGVYGPSIASEVIARKPVFITAASNNLENAKKIQNLFQNSNFSVYNSENILIAEYAAIIKNIYAILSGMASAIFKSQSTLSSIISVSISEIRKIICVYRRVSLKTANFDIASLADIILTTTTNKSRNFSLGYSIGENDDAKKIIREYSSTVEGLNSCKLLYKDLSDKGYDFPILTILYEILYNDKKPSSFLTSIFNLKDL